MTKIVLKSLADLSVVAKEIITVLDINDIKNRNNCLAFYGEMGAGKTTLIKAICNELGVTDITSSPTFSIVNEYDTSTQGKIFHFDFYRINSESEAYDFGYEEYFFSKQLCFIEWPEKVEKLLPLPHHKINIRLGESNLRLLEISTIV